MDQPNRVFEKKYKLNYKKIKSLKPQEIIETINKIQKKIQFVFQVGQHQQWTARHFDFDYPKTLVHLWGTWSYGMFVLSQ